MLAEFVDYRQPSVAEDFVAFSAWLTNDNGWNEENDEGYTPSGDYSEDLPSADLEGADNWIGQTAGDWPRAREDERPFGDLEGADKWTDHALNFDGIYLTSDGQLMFVIGDDDGTQKRVLSYEEAMHTDMGGVCDFLSAKMQQKLAAHQL